MGLDQPFVVPSAVLRAFEDRDEATREWANGLSAVVGELLRAWRLWPDGTVRAGEAGVVVPVRRADGTHAALKVQPPRPETDAAILGLLRWDGRGAVRLLDSDAARGAMLLEHLHGDRSLEMVENDDDAVRVVGTLLGRLHNVPPPDGLPRVSAVLSSMLDDAATATRALESDDRHRVHRWARSVTELQSEPGDRLLHWDLHYGNVLAADREPWLAIDPEPLIGDPGFDLWPALDSGWSTRNTAADVPQLIRRRFDVLTEMLGLDRDRARAWTIARLLQNTLWDIEDGHSGIRASATAVDDALASHS